MRLAKSEGWKGVCSSSWGQEEAGGCGVQALNIKHLHCFWRKKPFGFPFSKKAFSLLLFLFLGSLASQRAAQSPPSRAVKKLDFRRSLLPSSLSIYSWHVWSMIIIQRWTAVEMSRPWTSARSRLLVAILTIVMWGHHDKTGWRCGWIITFIAYSLSPE